MISLLFNSKKRKKAKELSQYQRQVALIRELEREGSSLSDAALAQSLEKQRGLYRANYYKTEEDLLAQCFALVSIASQRALGKSPYDSQIIGALAMAQGQLIEMRTGEGKTLVAPFIVFWQSVKENQTHVCTANDFLAKRDAIGLTPLYNALGLSTAVCLPGQSNEMRREIYKRDVVYGTHSEFALDYLRDQLQPVGVFQVQVRGRQAILVDEADSVMIDEAAMPVSVFMPVAGSAEQAEVVSKKVVDYLSVCEEPSQKNMVFAKTLQALSEETSEAQMLTEDQLKTGDFFLDPTRQLAVLTDQGYSRATALLIDAGLLTEESANYQAAHQALLQKVSYALTAKYLLRKDWQYVVQDNQLIPIDAITGRLNRGRTWSEPLTQALEAKEGVTISPDRIVAASIPLQKFFAQYSFLTGMSGTLMTEVNEFASVYGLTVFEVPPNNRPQRRNLPDELFLSLEEKHEALIEDIQSHYENGRPIMVVTASVEQSEEISQRLTELGLPFNLLNAANHAKEAPIFAQAGRKGAITITTNMAGRGVDIVLGGSLDTKEAELKASEQWASLDEAGQEALMIELLAAHEEEFQFVRGRGGLTVIGLERFDTRRKDAQLRGRTGRQGDPGSSQFYVSLEDSLVKSFAGDRIKSILKQLDLTEDIKVKQALLSKAIQEAQRQAEEINALARQQLLKKDEIPGRQRDAYYSYRSSIINPTKGEKEIVDMLEYYAAYLMHVAGVSEFVQDSEVLELKARLAKLLAFNADTFSWPDFDSMDQEQIQAWVFEQLLAKYQSSGQNATSEESRLGLRQLVVLQALDQEWMKFLSQMEELRQGIHLRAHARENPEHVFSRDSAELFEQMLESGRIAAMEALFDWANAPAEKEIEAEEVPA